MKLRAISLAAGAVLIAGCNTNTQLNKAVVDDREAAISRCIHAVNLSGPGAKSELKIATRASDQQLAYITCSRIFKAVQSGRITWADMGKIQRGQGTEIMRVLKGQ